MTENPTPQPLSRRSFLTAGVGVVGAAFLGSRLIAAPAAVASPRLLGAAVPSGRPQKQVHLAGTDGWVSMPQGAPPDLPFFPDPLAPSGFNTYVFGFRNVTGMTSTQVAAQRGHAQISAPMMSFDQEDDITITLTNLGCCSGRTCSTVTRCTGTASSTRSRSSTVSRSSRSRCRSGVTSRTSTARTTLAPTCTTATSKTWSTCRWA